MIETRRCPAEQRLNNQAPAADNRGTLVLTCGCREGLLIAADRRLLRDRRVVSDDDRKLFPSGENLVLAVTGVTRFSVSNEHESEKTVFDLSDLIGDSVARRGPLDALGFLRLLSDRVSAGLAPVLRTVVEKSQGSAEPLFRVLSFAIDEKKGLTHGVIEPLVRRIAGTTQYQVEATCSYTTEFPPYPQYKAGEKLSWAEILEGNEQELRAIRKDGRLLRWYEFSQRERQSLNSAEDVAETMKYVVFVASRTQEIKFPNRPSISPTSDCLLLQPGIPWRWIYENEQPCFGSQSTDCK